MAEEIKQKFSGKWKSYKTENFEEFLIAMGLNFLIRKMASLAKPENEILVQDDGKITIRNNSTFMAHEQSFKINEEFEDVNQFAKKRFKNMPTYENGKIRVTPTPAEPVDVPYPDYAEREITENGEMLVTIKVKDVECKRWFKKVES
ncbi:fatty acid-binding protein homolog 1-like [Babylonia areolata]|uniref:fatty acid-binding protein homolog 1-like n=1 Tax=Babylonia areolata TaxID=304850 RepID=UPI003FCF179C